MADVKPFRGLRPGPDLVSRVASPPYDVVTTEENGAWGVLWFENPANDEASEKRIP